MTATRQARVPMTEQIRLINECRHSGMTDVDWCRENGIAVSTFYKLGQPLSESGSGPDPSTELRSSCRSISKTGCGPH